MGVLELQVWLTLLPFALTRTFCGFQAGTWWEGKVRFLLIPSDSF